MICERCGEGLEVGDWPFCPHGRTGNFTNFRDEIPGGIVCENYGRDPIRFDSHSERRAYMELAGLYEKEKFCPFPGTDKDPMGVQNPAGYVDAKTLENGAILMTRGTGAKDVDPVESGLVRGQFNITGTDKDALAVAQGGDKYRQARVGRRLSGNQDGT